MVDESNSSRSAAAGGDEMTVMADRNAARRREYGAAVAAATGIDEAMIDRLVRDFYGRARRDPLLGPVFEAHVHDWEAHFVQMDAFWSSVTLMTGSYHGQPMQKHQPLPIDGQHFDRWLALFEEAAQAVCPPVAAELFTERARRIAESLEMGVAMGAGKMLMRGERYRRDPD